MTSVILLFRNDLRLADHPALLAAIDLCKKNNSTLIPLYVLDDSERPALGGAARWWLHHALQSLDSALQQKGQRLILQRGNTLDILKKIIQTHTVSHIVSHAAYDAWGRQQQSARANLSVDNFVVAGGTLLFEPGDITTKDGSPPRVFTPFWKNCLARGALPIPLPVPALLPSAPNAVASDNLDDWGLLPTAPNWAGGFDVWQPGEGGAMQRLQHFIQHGLQGYKQGRDRPDLDHVSRLSPHLRFGEISPRQIWHITQQAMATNSALVADGEKFLAEIGWREFSYNLLWHNPDLATQPLNQKFNSFPWHDDDDALRIWQQGQTGYPIVDAGMRQLWQTGWMHNRVRMIVASFLVKDLLLPWQRGEEWFWDTLVDADAASNTASWQWVAGCGADAAPYFRVFNPVLQGKKNDPSGDYVRQFVPELRALPDAFIHEPWNAPPLVLHGAGIMLGRDYPLPMVDHAMARDRALAAFAKLKEAAI